MASKRQSSASQEAGIMDDVIVTQLPFSHPDGTLCFQQGIWAVTEEGKGLLGASRELILSYGI